MTVDECSAKLMDLYNGAELTNDTRQALAMAVEALQLLELPRPQFTVDATVCMLSAMEESAEITQAASKVIRSITPGNPTPVSRLDAKYRLNIEIGDLLCVLLMAEKIGLIDWSVIRGNCRGKMRRWAERLNCQPVEG